VTDALSRREARAAEARELQARELQACELQAREQHAREQHAREQHARELQAREKHAREQHAREQHARELQAREQHAREQHAREQHARELQAREQHARELQAREQHALELQAREQRLTEARVPSTRQTETRRTETRPTETRRTETRRAGAQRRQGRRGGETARAPHLPWHLRRSFLLPVAGVCLIGSLSCTALVAGTVYPHLRDGGSLTELPAVLTAAGSRSQSAPTADAAAGAPADVVGGEAADEPEVPAAPAEAPAAPVEVPAPEVAAEEAPAGGGEEPDSADDEPAGPDDAAASAAAPKAGPTALPEDAGDAGAPGDVTYEGFGSAAAVLVDYTVDGEAQGRDDLGATFALPQPGSASWGEWSVTVMSDEEDGDVGCRIVDASGTVLVEQVGEAPYAEASCSWGDPAAGSDDE